MASAATAWRVIAALDERQLEAVRQAREACRRVWELADALGG